MSRPYSANHPISGQLFRFGSKTAGDTWVAEVFAATGYAPQLFPLGPAEAEPVAQVSEPAADAAPKDAELPASVSATTSEPGVPA